MLPPRHDPHGTRRAARCAAGIAACLAASLAGNLSAAEPDVRAWLRHDWHSVEVVLFRYRAVATTEQLVRLEPRRYPLPLSGFAPAHGLPHADVPAPVDALPGEDMPLPPAWMWMDVPAVPTADALDQPGHAPESDAAGPDSEGQTDGSERTVAAPPSSPESVARAAFEAFEEGLVHASMRWREDDLALAAHVRRLRRSPDYEVLHHGRWLQPTAAPGRAIPLLVQFGTRRPDGLFEVEGTLRISRGRYLRVDAELWLHAASNGGEPGYAVLSETRRMRARSVHYLDHPMLGLALRAEQLEIPEALVQLARIAEEGL